MYTHRPQKRHELTSRIVWLITVVVTLAIVSLIVTYANRVLRIVRSSSSTGYADQTRFIGSDQWELFPSQSGAAQMFDEQLQQSKAYQEFSPCFDDRGKRIGERAAMWMHSPTPTKAFWRIVWTERTTDSSQLYWTEADTLEVARALEIKSSAKWRPCTTSNSLDVIGEPARP